MTKAFVFPGQGSQAVGMLSDSQPEVEPVFKRASDVLGYDLWELTQNGPEDRLNATEFTQPALLTASYALWLVAKNAGLTADFVAGAQSWGIFGARCRRSYRIRRRGQVGTNQRAANASSCPHR